MSGRNSRGRDIGALRRVRSRPGPWTVRRMKNAAPAGGAEQEQVAPGLLVVHGVEEDQVGRCGGRPADRVRALEHAHRASALLGVRVLGQQCGADGPLGAEGEAVQRAPEQELLEVLGRRGQRREERVAEDHEGEHAYAAVAVGERAAEHAAEGRGDEADRHDERPVGRGQAERRGDRGQREREHRPVEAVEAPAEPGRHERPALLDIDLAFCHRVGHGAWS